MSCMIVMAFLSVTVEKAVAGDCGTGSIIPTVSNELVIFLAFEMVVLTGTRSVTTRS